MKKTYILLEKKNFNKISDKKLFKIDYWTKIKIFLLK